MVLWPGALRSPSAFCWWTNNVSISFMSYFAGYRLLDSDLQWFRFCGAKHVIVHKCDYPEVLRHYVLYVAHRPKQNFGIMHLRQLNLYVVSNYSNMVFSERMYMSYSSFIGNFVCIQCPHLTYQLINDISYTFIQFMITSICSLHM